MNTETVTVHQKGEDFEIIVQHDQTGSAYGMPLSKNAYEQLRQHFVSDLLIAWEQFKKANWYPSEAVDVEKMLMDKFQAIYNR
jgi:hypothetical protein